MFETTITKLESAKQAGQLIYDVRAIYAGAKLMQGKLALYLAATDPAFNASVNALFNTSERSELNAMLAEVNALVTDWETNHRAAIGLG